MPNPDTSLTVTLTPELSGERLDKALAILLPEHTRGNIQKWIRDEQVLINGAPVSQKQRAAGNEVVNITIPEAEEIEALPEDIPLDVIDTTADCIVINKPAGLVVHPGAGNSSGTLLNALLHHFPGQSRLPRAGIVHRLDKDTTGLMVVARTETARQHFIEQLQSRVMHREYLAVAEGVMIGGETVEQPIGRNRFDRLKMAVSAAGKPAITHLKVIEKYRTHTLVNARLQTGRTHQIRVHLSYRGFPIAGDVLYGSRCRIPPQADAQLVEVLQNFQRQALHARELRFTDPVSAEPRAYSADMPADMDRLVNLLRENARQAG